MHIVTTGLKCDAHMFYMYIFIILHVLEMYIVHASVKEEANPSMSPLPSA